MHVHALDLDLFPVNTVELLIPYASYIDYVTGSVVHKIIVIKT